MSHWFFLSYARDNLEKYTRKFYHDLNVEIRNLTAPGEGEGGFFDERSIDLGKTWPDELTTALQNCRAFVSLYSPAYFTKDYCGKEWQIFSLRQAAYTSRLPPHATPPSLVLPVLWVPEAFLPNPLPEAALVVQHHHRDFGEIYAREGLRRLMDLSRLRDHYRDFVGKFAKKLVQATREHSLPPDPQVRPIREVKNAFHGRVPVVTQPETRAIRRGPGIVKFIFVAGRRDELRAVRNRIEPYGEKGGRDWQPYLPDTADEVGIIAQRITTEEQFHYEPMDISDNVVERIKEAERQNNIVAIVVDTWTLRLPQYKNSMREYDDRKSLNCILLVSWNNRDVETEVERSTLIHDMTETFYNNFIQPDPNCFLEINSHDELKKELPIALHKALQRIVQKARVVKRADGGRCITKPVITGVKAKGISA